MKAISLLAALLIAIPATASAQSTVQAFGGRTSVFPSDELLTALADLQLELEPIKPGRTEGERITFRIPGGAIDLDALAGEILHLGGLRITDGATDVALLDFVIDTIAAPLLTGLVVVDGELVGRLPLFELELTSAPELNRGGRILRIDGVELSLTAEAADALNAVFGVSDFAEGLDVGEARVFTRIVARNLGNDADGNDAD